MPERTVVLDACALIAFFNDEKGAERVEEILGGQAKVLVAAINLLEVAYDAIRSTGKPTAGDEILEAVGRLPCQVVWDLDEKVLLEAARIKSQYRLSLADSVAVGLANCREAVLASSDRHEFTPVLEARDVDVLWIR